MICDAYCMVFIGLILFEAIAVFCECAEHRKEMKEIEKEIEEHVGKIEKLRMIDEKHKIDEEDEE